MFFIYQKNLIFVVPCKARGLEGGGAGAALLGL